MTDDELDQALRALAHPARRTIMRVTATVRLPAGRVAIILGMAPATASEHLRVMRGAGLADVTVEGARRLYGAVPARVDEVTAELLERTSASASAAPGPTPPAPDPTPPAPNPTPPAPDPPSAPDLEPRAGEP
jgi:DNA-binding transcriptional ArsR family regulator